MHSTKKGSGSTEPIVAEDFPSAIEAIPVGSTTDLDAEVTEQETIAASQDTLVGDIMAALEGKAIGGGEISMVTTTISEDSLTYGSNGEPIIIPELIGAKYFIIQGNPLTAQQIKETNYTDDAGLVRQIMYLNGIVYLTGIEMATDRKCYTTTKTADTSDDFSFDETTGAICLNWGFYKVSTDTSTTGIAYTVYRLG